MKHLVAILFASAHLLVANSATITGRVTDRSSGEALVGVNIVLQGTLRGTTTSTQGEFLFPNVTTGAYSLSFSLIGYQRQTLPIAVVSEDEILDFQIQLSPIAIQTEPVIVTASKREQSLLEVPVSVSVLDAAGLAYRNSLTIDDALRYIPGVNMTEFQVNIRGSSGYGRGVGSRVLMLVDGIPFLTGDTGELNFETIPVGQVDRIEVVKGASSALYGSSALGGVINVLTRPIAETPETRIRTYGGFYNSPSHSQWEWTKETRFSNGQSVSHSRKIDNVGFAVFGSRLADDGYRQNDFRRRYNAYLKTRYDISSFDALTLTFNIFHQKRGSFLYWKDLNNALVPPDDQQGDRVQSTRFFVSGLFNRTVSPGFFYSVKGMWFRNNFSDNVSVTGDRSESDVIRTEVQATWSPNATHIITSGIEGHIDRVDADLFGKHSGGGIAVYAQDELQPAEQFRATLGARLDFQDVDSLESSSQLNPKVGLLYIPVQGTTLRASFGRGFRSPSVAEAFVTTQVGPLRVGPNPTLKPERSYSYELGASQLFGDVALIDVALFQTDFTNLIEASVTTFPQAQFSNVTKARIQGIETSAKFGLFTKALFVDIGYTYVYPKDRTKDDILKYRPRHVLYASGLLRYGALRVGVDFRYLSRVERIDEELVTPPLAIVKDGGQRVEILLTDVRLAADLTQLDFPLVASLNITNIFQYNYVELIGNLGPPRNIVLVLEAKL